MASLKIAQACVFAIGLVVALVLTARPAPGQAVSARLVGTVQDSTRSRIGAAAVTVREVDTGLETRTTASSEGEYTFPNLTPGRYLVTGTAQGFGTTQISDLLLEIGDAKSLDIVLSPETASQSIQVVESEPTVDTGSTKVGAVVGDRQALDLPLNGRDAMTLFYLQAGTNPLDNQEPSGSQQQIGAVDGLPPGTSSIYVEGILAENSSFDYSPAHPSFPVPQEAVGEYRVSTTGNGASDGAASGAQVKVLIKSGTNAFHGSVYDFLRNSALDANDFFNKFDKSADNIVQQDALHKNQFGFAVGGPILRNRTFFFATTEWQRQTQNTPLEATVYTASVRQGQFLYNNQGRNSTSLVDPRTGAPLIPSSQIGTIDLTTVDPARQGFDTAYLPQYLQETPLPNAWDVGDGLNTAGYRYQSPDPDNYYQTILKVDHVLNQKNAINATLAQASENAPESRYYTGVVMEGYTEQRRGLSVRVVTSFTPSVTNEFSGGGSLRHALRANTTTYCEDPTGNITLNIGTLCDNRDAQNNPAVSRGVADVLTKVSGRHTLEAGGEWWNETLNRQTGLKYPAINTSNSYNPADVPALAGLNSTDQSDAKDALKDVTGYVGTISQNFYLQPNGQNTQFGVLREELRKNEWGLFLGDSWRVTGRLTANLGLRWDILPVVTNLNPVVYPAGGYNGALGIQGPAGAPTSWELAPDHGAGVVPVDWHALAPSAGVIWDPFGDGRSAVRASYHISNVRGGTVNGDFSIANQGLSNSVTLQTAAPGVRLSTVGSVLPIPVPAPLEQPGNIRQGSAYVADPNLKTPHVQEWSFGLDRELFRGWKLSATYVGNRASGLWDGEDLNQIEIRSNGFLSAFEIAQQNLAANGSPTTGVPLGNLQELFAEVPAAEYTAITQGQVAALANYLDTASAGGLIGGYVAAAGLPATFFRLNPQFRDLYVVGDYGQTSWNALKLEGSHQIRNGLHVQANYTISKGFTDASGEAQDADQNYTTSFRDNQNHALDRQLSPLDTTHVILANGIYELPVGRGKPSLNSNRLLDQLVGGWQVNGIFNFTTGRPISVTTGYYLLNQNVASVPNFDHSFRNLARVYKTGTSVTFLQPSQLAAFSNPAPGQVGEFTGQSIHGPHYTNLDAGLYKSFRLPAWRESARLQLRAEYFNVLNHANFLASSININSGTVGRVTSTESPRIGQLAAKLTF